ncbi:MAG: serine--tRNA ligase [Thermoproteota archaeon]|jgi:seryl-tRNA synthetase|nr:serine--tRNA ligase [Thermoproteota archaeon]
MIDLEIIRKKSEIVAEALRKRNIDFPLNELIEYDKQYRAKLKELDKLRHEKNVLTLKFPKEEDKEKLKRNIDELDQKIRLLEKEVDEIKNKRDYLLHRLPNIPHESVPYGKGPEDNVVVRVVGEPRKFSFKPKPHYELAEELDIIDFERGTKLAGSGFYMLKEEGAILERALINFMLDTHKKKGYKEIFPPILILSTGAFGTGHLPRFAEDMYKIENEDLWLLPTAELALVNIHANETLNYKDLPLYYTAYTPCFRKEAGRHVDLKGILRVHQFNKVELVKITPPETSYEELEKLVNDAEDILKLLGIPYRVVLLCTGDLGFASAKTYDIEAWFPSQNKYIEVSSCSNCGDFQARRANIKFVGGGRRNPEYVHTLNGSGLAIGRTLAALIENYQQEDGSIVIPEVLRKYTGFDVIKKKD